MFWQTVTSVKKSTLILGWKYFTHFKYFIKISLRAKYTPNDEKFTRYIMLFLIALYFKQNEWTLMMNSYKIPGFSSVPKNTGQGRAGWRLREKCTGQGTRKSLQGRTGQGYQKSTGQVTGCQNRAPCSSLSLNCGT